MTWDLSQIEALTRLDLIADSVLFMTVRISFKNQVKVRISLFRPEGSTSHSLKHWGEEVGLGSQGSLKTIFSMKLMILVTLGFHGEPFKQPEPPPIKWK